jgi:hypothetical protein
MAENVVENDVVKIVARISGISLGGVDINSKLEKFAPSSQDRTNLLVRIISKYPEIHFPQKKIKESKSWTVAELINYVVTEKSLLGIVNDLQYILKNIPCKMEIFTKRASLYDLGLSEYPLKRFKAEIENYFSINIQENFEGKLTIKEVARLVFSELEKK